MGPKKDSNGDEPSELPQFSAHRGTGSPRGGTRGGRGERGTPRGSPRGRGTPPGNSLGRGRGNPTGQNPNWKPDSGIPQGRPRSNDQSNFASDSSSSLSTADGIKSSEKKKDKYKKERERIAKLLPRDWVGRTPRLKEKFLQDERILPPEWSTWNNFVKHYWLKNRGIDFRFSKDPDHRTTGNETQELEEKETADEEQANPDIPVIPEVADPNVQAETLERAELTDLDPFVTERRRKRVDNPEGNVQDISHDHVEEELAPTAPNDQAGNEQIPEVPVDQVQEEQVSRDWNDMIEEEERENESGNSGDDEPELSDVGSDRTEDKPYYERNKGRSEGGRLRNPLDNDDTGWDEMFGNNETFEVPPEQTKAQDTFGNQLYKEMIGAQKRIAVEVETLKSLVSTNASVPYGMGDSILGNINNLQQFMTDNRDRYEEYLHEHPELEDEIDYNQCNILIKTAHKLDELIEQRQRMENRINVSLAEKQAEKEKAMIRQAEAEKAEQQYQDFASQIDQEIQVLQEKLSKMDNQEVSAKQKYSTPAIPSLLTKSPTKKTPRVVQQDKAESVRLMKESMKQKGGLNSFLSEEDKVKEASKTSSGGSLKTSSQKSESSEVEIESLDSLPNTSSGTQALINSSEKMTKLINQVFDSRIASMEKRTQDRLDTIFKSNESLQKDVKELYAIMKKKFIDTPQDVSPQAEEPEVAGYSVTGIPEVDPHTNWSTRDKARVSFGAGLKTPQQSGAEQLSSTVASNVKRRVSFHSVQGDSSLSDEPSLNLNRRVYQTHMDDQWYFESFTGPWQTHPDPAPDLKAKHKAPSVAGIDVFSGIPERYPEWRNQFIAAVHTSCAPWKEKLQALFKVLDKSKPEVGCCIPVGEWNPLLYARIIDNLENKFGGEERTIEYYYNLLREVPPCDRMDYKHLEVLLNRSKGLYDVLQVYDRLSSAEDKMIFREVKSRICDFWRKSFLFTRHQASRTGKVTPTIKSLMDFMNDILTDHRDDQIFDLKLRDKGHKNKKSFLVKETGSEIPTEPVEFRADSDTEEVPEASTTFYVQKSNSGPLSCACCGQPHLLKECKKFLKLNFSQRRDVMKAGNHCIGCFSKKHWINNCPRKIPCPKCPKDKPRYHHELMHPDTKEKSFLVLEDEESGEDEHVGSFDDQFEEDLNTHVNLSRQAPRDTLGLPISPVLVKNPKTGKFLKFNALLDDGSQRNLMTIKAAAKLDLYGISSHLKSTGVGGVETDHGRSLMCEVFVKGVDPKLTKWRTMVTSLMEDVVGNLRPIAWNEQKKIWPHLSKIPVPDVDPNAEVDLIIGVKNSELLAALEPDVIGPEGGPIARKTNLGWVIFGATSPDELGRDPDFDSKKLERVRQMRNNKIHCLISDSDIYSAACYQPRVEESRIFLCHSIENSKPKFFENPLEIDNPDFLTPKGKDPVDFFDKFWADPIVQASCCTDPDSSEISDENSVKQEKISNFATRAQVLDRDLNYLFEKQMEIERIPDDEEKAMSQDNKYAQNLIERSMKRLENGHYQVGCLWKKGEPTLKNNWELAIQRHRNLMTSALIRNPATNAEFQARINEWVSMGHAREVPPEEQRPLIAWYLPIFGVPDMTRETTKVRVVADGRAEYKGRSLNGSMLAGPCKIRDITHTLTRFRRFQYVLVADVSRMFLQVYLDPQDRVYHRFLYADSPEKEPKEYEFLVHCFGNAGSPTVAISVVQNFAKTLIDVNPRAVETVLESTHVDDTSDSFETEEEAIEVGHFLRDEIYAKVGMNLRKFASNSPTVLKSFKEEEWASGIVHEFFKDNYSIQMPTKKILGVAWDIQTDELSFPEGSFANPEILTKRIILRETAKIFDPLGLIGPVLIVARALLQKIWVEKLEWDDPLPEIFSNEWSLWIENSKNLKVFRIPRVIIPTREVGILEQEIHTFCDASAIAFCAVIYLKTTYEDGHVHISFVGAKTKVAPMKLPTMARLELEAAQLGALLTKSYNKILKVKNFRMWTDNRNVLGWLSRPSRELKMFVNNRVESILNITSVGDWDYIHTNDNPADIGSRGCDIQTLQNSELWKQGPDFIKLPESEWPQSFMNPKEVDLDEEGTAELSKSTFICLYSKQDFENLTGLGIDVEAHSSWSKYHRIVRNVLKFAIMWKNRTFKTDKFLTTSEINQKATDLLLKEIQIVHFSEEREELLSNNRLKNTSRLLPLRVFMGKDGLIRMNSRCALSETLPYDQKFPVVLPKGSNLVHLLIKHVHEKVIDHNGGYALLLTELQTKFWIIQGKAQCKAVTRNCILCKRIRKHPISTIQGFLPTYRIPGSKVAPFSRTIVDAAGPFAVKVKRSTVKRYIIVYSCLIYRALHLEVVDDLSQDSFLCSFERFVARRGQPTLVRSDNGTNFRGACKELRDLWLNWNENEFIDRGFGDTTWIFSAPYAAHTQGPVERMVGLVKKGLMAKMHDRSWTEEVLRTVTVRVEGILNSRPLTYISTNPEDPRPLTPNSFLLPMTEREMAPIPDLNNGFLKRKWLQVNQTLDSLWHYFVREMVPSLHKNTVKGWDVERRNLQPGDIVCLLEDKERGLWPLGRVSSVKPDPDGVVRFADVVIFKKGKPGSFDTNLRNRHINRLMLLLPAEESPKNGSKPSSKGN